VRLTTLSWRSKYSLGCASGIESVGESVLSKPRALHTEGVRPGAVHTFTTLAAFLPMPLPASAVYENLDVIDVLLLVRVLLLRRFLLHPKPSPRQISSPQSSPVPSVPLSQPHDPQPRALCSSRLCVPCLLPSCQHSVRSPVANDPLPSSSFRNAPPPMLCKVEPAEL